MIVQDYVFLDGSDVIATWQPAPFLPPPALTRQSSGICFCDGLVLLVKDADGKIMLPGGTIEPGETFEQTLYRELQEEANAVVEASVYLGAQHFEVAAQPVIYQVRYWTQVRLLPFMPQYEIVERLLVPPTEVPAKLNWQTVKVLHAMLTSAQNEENRRRRM